MEPKPQRLISLDAFRGMTIAGMILVNNPGTWGAIYPPLEHAHWNGCTPTDLVFPFFLFIVGVAMAFSFGKRTATGGGKLTLLGHVIRRSLILILLGECMYGFPDFRLITPFILAIAGLQLFFGSSPATDENPRPAWPGMLGAVLLVVGVLFFAIDFGHFQQVGLRVPGVLQRIGACYFLASLVVLMIGERGAAVFSVLVLIGYTLLIKFVDAPADFVTNATGVEGRLHDWVDMQLLAGHLYSHRPDPEGLMSTLPAVVTVLLGVFAGRWLRSDRDHQTKLIGLFVAANVGILLGLGWDLISPMNKKIWTSAYVLFTAGLALHGVGMFYWLLDIRGWRKLGWPFLVFGSNAIVVFFASSMAAKSWG